VPRSAARRSGSCRLYRLLEVLREDNRAIVRAASQASKAADYLLGFVPEPIISGLLDSVAADHHAA
jgi:antirestriction protein ArdC